MQLDESYSTPGYLFDNVIMGSVNHPLETWSLLSAAGSAYRPMSGTGRLNSVEIPSDVPCNTYPDNPPDIALSEMKSRAVRRIYHSRTGSHMQCTHPDNPFPVCSEVTNRTDSRHFDGPAELRLFEDVAGVSGNRCIKHGSSSTVVDWQMTVGIFFQDPDISKNTFRFPALPAINDTLGAYRPTSGTGSLNSAEIRCAVPEIFARERKRVRSAGNRVVVGEVRKTTTPQSLFRPE